MLGRDQRMPPAGPCLARSPASAVAVVCAFRVPRSFHSTPTGQEGKKRTRRMFRRVHRVCCKED